MQANLLNLTVRKGHSTLNIITAELEVEDMRTDYFNEGPPWKLVFENNLGFRHTLVIRDKIPPKEYRFPNIISSESSEEKREHCHIFVKVGQLGNTVAYKEKP